MTTSWISLKVGQLEGLVTTALGDVIKGYLHPQLEDRDDGLNEAPDSYSYLTCFSEARPNTTTCLLFPRPNLSFSIIYLSSLLPGHFPQV